MVAVGERNTRSSRSALCGTDAGHGFTGDAYGGQGLGLFAATAKNIGVAPLEAHQRPARLCQSHHEVDDAFLRKAVVAALLAYIDQLCAGGYVLQHILGHQVVVQHQTGTGQYPCGLERQQLCIARPGADQRHAPPGGAGHGSQYDGRCVRTARDGTVDWGVGKIHQNSGTKRQTVGGAIVKSPCPSVLDAHQGRIRPMR